VPPFDGCRNPAVQPSPPPTPPGSIVSGSRTGRGIGSSPHRFRTIQVWRKEFRAATWIAAASSVVCATAAAAAAERPAQCRRQHVPLIRLAHLFDGGVERVTDLRVFEIARCEENLQVRPQPARRRDDCGPCIPPGMKTSVNIRSTGVSWRRTSSASGPLPAESTR